MSKRRHAPDGWEMIEPIFDILNEKMEESDEGDRYKGKSLWSSIKIHYEKSRFIYDLYYNRKAISKELYDYCLNQRIVDKELISKWNNKGCETLCCLKCIQTQESGIKGCICRMPRENFDIDAVIQCDHCGCTGCFH